MTVARVREPHRFLGGNREKITVIAGASQTLLISPLEAMRWHDFACLCEKSCLKALKQLFFSSNSSQKTIGRMVFRRSPFG